MDDYIPPEHPFDQAVTRTVKSFGLVYDLTEEQRGWLKQFGSAVVADEVFWQTVAQDDVDYQRVAKELEVANDEIDNLRAKLERAKDGFKKIATAKLTSRLDAATFQDIARAALEEIKDG